MCEARAGLTRVVDHGRRDGDRRGVPLLLTLVLTVLAVALGAAAVIAGESDDSPGLQGLGVLLAAGAVLLAVRAVRRR